MILSFAAFDVLSHGTILALPLALLAGVVAGCNPCCVALYPAAAAMYCGTSAADACCGTSVVVNGSGLKSAIAFVFGIAAATTVLGVIAALAGRVVGQLGSGFRYAIAAIPLIMGLHLLGWLRLPIGTLPQRAIRNGLMGAFGAGFLVSLALTPCGTPVLASVLSYVAYKASVVYGAILLFLYGIGSGVPVVLVGTTAGQITAKLERAGYGLWTERISGTALLALGLFLLWRA
jgi:cytochrome c-type biogenesis protein